MLWKTSEVRSDSKEKAGARTVPMGDRSGRHNGDQQDVRRAEIQKFSTQVKMWHRMLTGDSKPRFFAFIFCCSPVYLRSSNKYIKCSYQLNTSRVSPYYRNQRDSSQVTNSLWTREYRCSVSQHLTQSEFLQSLYDNRIKWMNLP